MKERALKHFRGPKRYNCAQAVLASSDKYTDVEDSKLMAYRNAGAGRVDGGLCGALFAAKQLMTHEHCRENARNHFRQHAGSVKCRDIRKDGRMSCHDCVAVAAELAESSLQEESAPNRC